MKDRGTASSDLYLADLLGLIRSTDFTEVTQYSSVGHRSTQAVTPRQGAVPVTGQAFMHLIGIHGKKLSHNHPFYRMLMFLLSNPGINTCEYMNKINVLTNVEHIDYYDFTNDFHCLVEESLKRK